MPRSSIAHVDVIGPDGKLTQRRAIARTVPGRALLGETQFPTGEVVPEPRRGEAIAEMPAGSPVRWRIFRARG